MSAHVQLMLRGRARGVDSLARSLHGGSVKSNDRRLCEATARSSHLAPHASRRVCQSQAIGVGTHLDSPLATRQAASLGAPLDLLLVAPAGEHALVAGLRGQLVAHRIVLCGPHVHGLAGVRVARGRVVLLHCVLRRRERRAHGLLLLLRWLLVLLLRRRLLAVLQADGRQVQRRQRHVCSRR